MTELTPEVELPTDAERAETASPQQSRDDAHAAHEAEEDPITSSTRNDPGQRETVDDDGTPITLPDSSRGAEPFRSSSH